MKKASKYLIVTFLPLLLGQADEAHAIKNTQVHEESLVEVESQVDWGSLVPQTSFYALLKGDEKDEGKDHDSDSVGPGGIQQKYKRIAEQNMVDLGHQEASELSNNMLASTDEEHNHQISDRMVQVSDDHKREPSVQLQSQDLDHSTTGSSERSARELLRGGNLAMLICGSVVLLISLPIIFMNERKMARIYYVLSRGK